MIVDEPSVTILSLVGSWMGTPSLSSLKWRHLWTAFCLCSSNWPIGYAHQVRAHRISAFFKCLLRTFTHSGPGKTKFVRKLPLFEEVRQKEVVWVLAILNYWLKTLRFQKYKTQSKEKVILFTLTSLKRALRKQKRKGFQYFSNFLGKNNLLEVKTLLSKCPHFICSCCDKIIVTRIHSDIL